MSDERDINDAIFTGIIGLAFLFLELKSEIQNPVNFNYIRTIIFVFLVIGIIRVYGVILNSRRIKFVSIAIFKLVFVPISAFLFPIILTTQFLPMLTMNKLSISLISTIILGFSIMMFEYTLFKMYSEFIKEELKIHQLSIKYIYEKIHKWREKKKKSKPFRQHPSKSSRPSRSHQRKR